MYEAIFNEELHKTFEKEDYATKIENNAKEKGNEDNLNNLSTIYVYNILKNTNLQFPQNYIICNALIEKIKSAVHTVCSAAKIKSEEKKIDYARKFDTLMKTKETDSANKSVAQQFCER